MDEIAEKTLRTLWFAGTIFLGGYLYGGLHFGLWGLFVWAAFICLLELRGMYQRWRMYG